MSIENDLATLLKPIVGNRVTPVTFPQPSTAPTWPAIRYTFIDGIPIVDSCGDGEEETDDVRVQLDVVAVKFADARALRRQIRGLMKTFDPPAILDAQRSEYDEETRTFREVLDYVLQGSTST